MPTCLSASQTRCLSKLRFTVILLLSPLFFHAQTLTGLWTGALSNDSTTVRKDQLFEIALTEYKGKVYGYSRSEFIVNDTLYYIVKRVKGTITGDVCEVTDDDIIAYNFRGKLDKGIKVTSTFRRNGTDSSWYLAGNWKTNATKKYYSVTGKVDLEQEKDLTASKIFPHLEELNLARNIDFYKERNDAPVIVRIARPEKVKTEYAVTLDPVTPGLSVSPNPVSIEIARVEINEEPEAVRKPGDPLSKTETRDLAAKPVFDRPKASGQTAAIQKPVIPPTEEKQPASVSANATAQTYVPSDLSPGTMDKRDPVLTTGGKITPANQATPGNPPANTNPAVSKTLPANTATTGNPEASNQSLAKNIPVQKNTNPDKTAVSNTTGNKPVTGPNTTVAKTNPTPTQSPVAKTPSAPASQNSTTTAPTTNNPVAIVKPVKTSPRKTIDELTEPVTVIAGRLSEFKQVVNFKSDSLVLSLYDNGEIDGDTVSVLLNGELIMARQGLKASAIRKTIYIQPGQNEDFTLVLFAENLGKYPPNTGLLVVHDGDDIYHLRFSSDYEKSAGIVFRRK